MVPNFPKSDKRQQDLYYLLLDSSQTIRFSNPGSCTHVTLTRLRERLQLDMTGTVICSSVRQGGQRALKYDNLSFFKVVLPQTVEPLGNANRMPRSFNTGIHVLCGSCCAIRINESPAI